MTARKKSAQTAGMRHLWSANFGGENLPGAVETTGEGDPGHSPGSSPLVFVKFDKIRSFLWFWGDLCAQGFPFSWLSGAGRSGSLL
jgi:hypothetical protein